MAGKAKSEPPKARPARTKAAAAPPAPQRAPVIASIRAETPMLTGAALTILMFTTAAEWTSELKFHIVTAGLFLLLFAVMIWCAFGVVRHAEVLAEEFGEPYGTLILTVAVISIEVAIMATVMLRGGPNPELPRDTVYAVLMIVLNGMVGLSVVLGALRHKQQQYNLQGAVAFLAVITSLAVISLVVPTFTKSTSGGTLTVLQAVVFAALTAALYGGFVLVQTMRHRTFFVETPTPGIVAVPSPAEEPPRHAHRGPRHSAGVHAALLIASLLPVVLLAKPLAHVIDFGIEEAGAPAAIGGIVIAILVLSPEGLSAFHAARRNQLQRAVNLSLGSALSTIGLTIPTMLLISLAIGIPLELGLPPVETVMLVLTLVVAQMTFSGAPTNILLGCVHLVLFAAFIVLIFNP
ncbi:MAG: calcium:proton antiporter [Pseudolabrys sp.]